MLAFLPLLSTFVFPAWLFRQTMHAQTTPESLVLGVSTKLVPSQFTHRLWYLIPPFEETSNVRRVFTLPDERSLVVRCKRGPGEHVVLEQVDLEPARYPKEVQNAIEFLQVVWAAEKRKDIFQVRISVKPYDIHLSHLHGNPLYVARKQKKVGCIDLFGKSNGSNRVDIRPFPVELDFPRLREVKDSFGDKRSFNSDVKYFIRESHELPACAI
jgi:hypothetical protein